MIRHMICFLALASLLVGVVGCDPPPIKVNQAELTAKPGVEPKANEVLFKMSEYLKQCKTFKFQADITRDSFFHDGLRVEYGGHMQATIKRPNMLKAVFDGDERSRRSWFDGKTISIFSVKRNMYAQAEIPGTIDQAIDYTFETFGFSVPLADLVYADPYEILTENVDKGFYIGQHKIDGVLCDHLAFQQEQIDWQVWIEAGDRPLLRKLIITYKTEEDAPEYRAQLSNWELNPAIRDAEFKFQVPAGAEKIEFLPIEKQDIEDVVDVEVIEVDEVEAK